MLLNERVKILRKALGLTQDAFAEQLGVSRAVINNLERGVLRNSNSVVPIVKLAASKFSVSEDWLFNGSGPAPEFVPNAGAKASEFLRASGLSSGEISAIRSYLSADRKAREAFAETFERVMREMTAAAGGVDETEKQKGSP